MISRPTAPLLLDRVEENCGGEVKRRGGKGQRSLLVNTTPRVGVDVETQTNLHYNTRRLEVVYSEMC